MQAALLLGPCDPAVAMVFEVSAGDMDAVWSLWQAPIGEPQCRPFGFRSKDLRSSTGNYIALGVLLGPSGD